jgi:hypothetical protein
VDGVVQSIAKEDGSGFNFIVDIMYHSTCFEGCTQTVKLFVRMDPETRAQQRCRIL